MAAPAEVYIGSGVHPLPGMGSGSLRPRSLPTMMELLAELPSDLSRAHEEGAARWGDLVASGASLAESYCARFTGEAVAVACTFNGSGDDEEVASDAPANEPLASLCRFVAAITSGTVYVCGR